MLRLLCLVCCVLTPAILLAGPAYGSDDPRWAGKLQAKIARADRLRVRTGGTCHRQIGEEKTLFEVADVNEIGRVVKLIEIEDASSGVRCMCCGEPTFEFYQAEKLIAAVGFHHGQLLRWSEGWKGDGVLTAGSAERLCRWLAEHDVRGPLEEWQGERRREAAAERRREAYEKILPAEVSRALRGAGSYEDAEAAFTDHVRGSDAPALYFRLLGCGLSPWRSTDQLEELLFDLLKRVEPGDAAAAIRAVEKDAVGTRGAARWVLWRAEWKRLPEAEVAAALPRLARAGLSHPDEKTRRRILWVLWRIGSEPAREVLREFASGTVVPLGASPEDLEDAGGMATYFPQEDDVQSERETTAAAVYLARLVDQASVKVIDQLLAKETGKDRDMLKAAAAQLQGQ